MLPYPYPHFTPIVLLGELFWIAVCLMVTTINSQAERKQLWKSPPFWMHFLSHSHVFLGKEANRLLPDWIQRVFCKRVDLSFTYSFLKLSIIHSLLKPRTRCQTKANSRLWEKFLSQLHKCDSGGTPIIKQSIK